MVGLLLVSLVASAGDDTIVVVTGRESYAAGLPSSSLERLYSGASAPDAARVRIVDYGADIPLRDAFYRVVTGRDGRQMHAFWLQFVFSGAGRGPVWVKDTDGMVAALREDPWAVGYLQEREVPADLRIVWRVTQ